MKILQTAVVVAISFLMMGSSSADEVWVVRADGVGQLRIGMTLLQVNQARGEVSRRLGIRTKRAAST